MIQTALGPVAYANPPGSAGSPRPAQTGPAAAPLSDDSWVRQAQLAAQPLQARLLEEARQVLLGRGAALPDADDPLNIGRQYLTMIENGAAGSPISLADGRYLEPFPGTTRRGIRAVVNPEAGEIELRAEVRDRIAGLIPGRRRLTYVHHIPAPVGEKFVRLFNSPDGQYALALTDRGSVFVLDNVLSHKVAFEVSTPITRLLRLEPVEGVSFAELSGEFVTPATRPLRDLSRVQAVTPETRAAFERDEPFGAGDLCLRAPNGREIALIDRGRTLIRLQQAAKVAGDLAVVGDFEEEGAPDRKLVEQTRQALEGTALDGLAPAAAAVGETPGSDDASQALLRLKLAYGDLFRERAAGGAGTHGLPAQQALPVHQMRRSEWQRQFGLITAAAERSGNAQAQHWAELLLEARKESEQAHPGGAALNVKPKLLDRFRKSLSVRNLRRIGKGLTTAASRPGWPTISFSTIRSTT